jgi:hypothetical protein
MEIRPSTSRERENLFLETFLDLTDKVSKVSRNSALAAFGGAVARTTGKAEKDIALALAELFPDMSFGSVLDRAAKNLGVNKRLPAIGSTTYVRISADPGTVYQAGVHQFISTEGPAFNLTQNVTVGSFGFAYAKVESVDVGSKANVHALTISRVMPAPSGHKNVINEARADWGRDDESDEIFRLRIKDSGNLYSRDTLTMLEQLCLGINSKVLKLFNYGIDNVGKRVLAVLTQNGTDLTQTELDTLRNGTARFLALSDSQRWGTEYVGVVYKNVAYQPIDISFRVVLDNSVSPDDVREKIQVAISKYLDFRTFNPSKQRVEWDNLLEICKSARGVRYIPDQYFYPRIDIGVHHYKMPRLRGFMMLNMDGSVISNVQGTLSPVYYPAVADFSYQQTVLQAI